MIVKVRVPPAGPMVGIIGVTANVHCTPASCCTFSVLPATVALPVRLFAVVLVSIVRVTLPLPLPLDGSTEIQLADAEAFQEVGVHPAGETVIWTDSVPPLPEVCICVGETENVQAVMGGVLSPPPPKAAKAPAAPPPVIPTQTRGLIPPSSGGGAIWA